MAHETTPYTLKDTQYGSITATVSNHLSIPYCKQMIEQMDKKKAANFIKIKQNDPLSDDCFNMLRKHNFSVYDVGDKIMTLARWNNTTKNLLSIGTNARTGVGIIIISRNMKSILVVKEKRSTGGGVLYDIYKPVTETVKRNETSLEGAIRGLKEEIGVTLPLDMEYYFIGGFDNPGCYVGDVNDIYMLYGVVYDIDDEALQKTKLQKEEGIKEVKWLLISDLPEYVREKRVSGRTYTVLKRVIENDKVKLQQKVHTINGLTFF